MMKKLEAISADRISALPESIIHRILKLLPSDDIKEVSSLSKTWFGFCSSFPFLDFDDYTFYNLYDECEFIEGVSDQDNFDPYLEPDSQRFLNYIGETLSRFHERNPRILIRRITFRITIINSRFASILVDHIRLALEHGVEKIYLETDGVTYSLPEALFASNSIRVLKIKGGRFLDSFRRGDIRVSCSGLRKLDIARVYIDEVALRSIISLCPLIEKLAIQDAMGLTNLRISRLYKLKSLVVSRSITTGNIKMVEVDAPMLHCLELSNGYGHHSFTIGMLECPRLSKLTLSDLEVGNFQLEKVLSRLPFLKSLSLTRLSSLTKFKISNDSLEELAVIGCKHLEELEINAPNLLRFVFKSNSVPLMAPIHTIMGESYIFLQIGCEPSLLENLAINFRNFLSHMKCVKKLDISFAIRSVERVVQPVNAIEFDSNSVSLVRPMRTIMGTSYVTLGFGGEPLLYDNNLAVKFRNFISRMGCVNYLSIHLKHFAMISVDEHEEPVTGIEELKIIVKTSESFHDIFNGFLRSYHPRILIMEIGLFNNIAGATTFMRDIAVGVGPCCSWLPYLEEISIVASKGGSIKDVIRLPMDGTVPSIALEKFFFGEFKFVFKW